MPMATSLSASLTQDLRKLLAFGSGVGIEIGAADLEVVVARVRAARVQVPGRLVIQGYAERPAGEWGRHADAKGWGVGKAHLK